MKLFTLSINAHVALFLSSWLGRPRCAVRFRVATMPALLVKRVISIAKRKLNWLEIIRLWVRLQSGHVVPDATYRITGLGEALHPRR